MHRNESSSHDKDPQQDKAVVISADLTGRSALVTGGASGIGLATVELLEHCGAAVAVNYLPEDQNAAAIVHQLQAAGRRVFHAPGDVSDADDAGRMIDAAIKRLGHLDILVNNAGRGTVEPVDFADLDAMTEALWDGILSTNLVGPFRCTRSASEMLKSRKGAIVNIASVAGLGVRGSSVAYSASKAALINLTISMSRALAPDVRVNAVAPGLIDTPWIAPWPADRKDASVERSLMKRKGLPSEIAQAVLFLVAGADYMTGQTLILDGGRA